MLQTCLEYILFTHPLTLMLEEQTTSIYELGTDGDKQSWPLREGIHLAVNGGRERQSNSLVINFRKFEGSIILLMSLVSNRYFSATG